MFVVDPNKARSQELKAHLASKFDMKDLEQQTRF